MINCVLLNDRNRVIAAFRTPTVPLPGDVIELARVHPHVTVNEHWRVAEGERRWRVVAGLDGTDVMCVFVYCVREG